MTEINSKNIKMLRMLHDLTQEDAAKLLSVATHTFLKKENGHREFYLSEAKILADYFDKPIEEVFFSCSVTNTETSNKKSV